MISHEYKCIFIHIPKCAGTSIETALGHHPSGIIKRGGQDHRSIRMIEQPMLTANIFSSKENLREAARRIRYRFQSQENPNKKITVTREQYKNYFKFTFVRNPWARALSCYKNVMRDESHKRTFNIVAPLSLNEFLRLFKGKWLLSPQTYWIKDFSGAVPLDYIGRFENLIEDFKEVCKRLHIDPITLPHEVKGTGTDYREGYDKESKEIVREAYKEEIEMFGYTFES